MRIRLQTHTDARVISSFHFMEDEENTQNQRQLEDGDEGRFAVYRYLYEQTQTRWQRKLNRQLAFWLCLLARAMQTHQHTQI